MGHGIHFFPQLESRRLLWLIGVTIVVIFLIQYSELPYANIFSSLFSTINIIPKAGQSSPREGYKSSESGMESGLIPLRDLNSSVAPAVHENVDSFLHTSDVKKTSPVHDSGLNRDAGGDKSLGVHANRDIDLLPGNSVEQSTNSSGSSVSNSSFEFLSGKQRHPFIINNTNPLAENFVKEKNVSSSEVMEKTDDTLSHAVPPENSSYHMASSTNADSNVRAYVESSSFLAEKDLKQRFGSDGRSGVVQKGPTLISKSSPMKNVNKEKQQHEAPEPAVFSISEMNKLLLQSRVSYHTMVPRWLSKADRELLYARSQIENAPVISNDPSLFGPLYRNVSMFNRSYELMEEMLKVYMYEEGEKPVMHQPRLRGIYASEGWFMKLLESNKRFLTKNPREAHLFYLPFSSKNLEKKLYVVGSHSYENLIQYLNNYVSLIASKHPFWNRTGGSDHFLVACHDWAPVETRRIMGNCIRALCNTNVKEGFKFSKDVSLPETRVHTAKDPLKDVGGKPPSKRTFLAFFAGKLHGYLRPILLQHWGNNKDPDMKIFGPMHEVKVQMNYSQYMKSSKYCICAKGYEVHSPRVVEAIFYECVPVIISDNFVPPFFDVLNWESFAVFVLEKNIPNLKNILLSIPENRYREMQMRVRKVQKHFLWHTEPVKYDIFHMILHSVWHNRIFLTRIK